MWKCPVCNTINEDNICCKKCGLDQSRNYTACRTFYPLSLDATSAFEKEKKHAAEKLKRGDLKLIQEIAAAVRKLEELSDAIRNLEEEPASMEKLEKILASIENYELEKPVPKEKISGGNQLMADTNPETIFGKKIDRKTVASVTFLDSKKEAGRDAWDVSEKQNGSVLAWTKKAPDGMLELYLGSEGKILANTDSSNLFRDYENLEEIHGLEHFHTGTARNMEGMFRGCAKLKELDLRTFDTSQVENMKWMFFRCRRLKELDLESLDTSQVKNMAGMFANCFQLEKLNLLHFQTGQVRDMENMFFYCRNLIRLNLSSFDTRKVENMSRMFLGCSELKELNLSSFHTERVSDMTAMFGHCNDVKELDIRGFDMSLIDSNLSFNEYTKLPGGVRIIRK